MFWPFDPAAIEGIERPTLFTNPFDYSPHPLVESARGELCRYIEAQSCWQGELSRGKMFGVLVVEAGDGSLGFLAAFSGYLDKRTHHPHFVPPILDLLDPQGFFATEEAHISQISNKIDALQSPELHAAQSALSEILAEQQQALSTLEAEYADSRQRRREQRAAGCSEAQMQHLGEQSQRQKGAIRRCELEFRLRRAPHEAIIEQANSARELLIEQRRDRSSALQRLTFDRFAPLNALGQSNSLTQIFSDYNNSTPPAGSGECAAPKLLHYAFAHSLRPVAMGEFWWGSSTRGEIRHHLHYYPACRGKCHPILTYMLQGLSVEPPRPRSDEQRLLESLSVIYEDEAIVAFDKPSGMASVRGLNHTISVQSVAEQRYPAIDPNTLVVHRLDMDTSGVIIMAKTAQVQRALQQQFADHTIRKRYVAIIEESPAVSSGAIELPLILDPYDRPRQRVDFDHGKWAYTHYSVLSQCSDGCRIALYPQSGRTHQLRVHCAHSLGLNSPIVGDRLYGNLAHRLMLHAEQITLIHPTSNRKFTLRATCPF